ncbi:Pre-mRNA-splicing factor cwf25 [Porphyridium purpureum]|uniref:Pre-mRNA-splicing factor cwf25 n=1 Tax=Porphyridium purpureum TaxID=35688 RepID=A0A5J4Z000_PORPP|nr:Pre-mRNA-splicing factor cwf25 [Porphyridium purpureum]|eukprot:POR1171..scf208_2
MSALSFLNKKSWHTRTLRNNERVWQAEQRDALEEKRVAELRKQIEHERHVEDLQRIGAEVSNGASRTAAAFKSRTQLEWMYEFGKQDAQDGEREELLLGKRAASFSARDKAQQPAIVSLDAAASGASLGHEISPNTAEPFDHVRLVDAATKVREDPLSMMQVEEDRLVMTNVTMGTIPRPSESISEFDACNSGLAEDTVDIFPQNLNPRKRKHASTSSRRANGDVRRVRKSLDPLGRRPRPSEYSSDSSDSESLRDNARFSSSSSSDDTSGMRERKRQRKRNGSTSKNRSKKSCSSSSGNRRSSRRREKKSRK